MATKPKCPSLVWIGSICGFFFAVLSFSGMKGSINKEQKSSAVRASGSSGWSLQTGKLSCLCSYGELGHIKWLAQGTKITPVYPQTHFRSFYYWSCIATLFPRNFTPYFYLSIIGKVKGNKKELTSII